MTSPPATAHALRFPNSLERLDSPAGAHGDRVGFAPRELRLRADAVELRTARAHVQRSAAALGFDADTIDAIVLAANEAVTNAIRHGESDAQGTIGLLIESDADGLTIVVSDSGSFVASAPDPSPMAEQGRGFVFMAGLMDEVDLTKGPDGTVVRLRKRRLRSPARAVEPPA